MLADGFAMLYHNQPKFPVTYLAHYLKNYTHIKASEAGILDKLASNDKIEEEMNKKEEERMKQ